MTRDRTLQQALLEVPPRETSGSRTANRFEFQNSWALCKLIELHRTGQDYSVVFEYHDDILVLNSTLDPPRIDFYQVKTKSTGDWKRSDLLRRPQGANGSLPSHLGKLVSNQLAFPTETGTLNFISNQGFRLRLVGQSSSTVQEVCLDALVPSELQAIMDALQTEHDLPDRPDCAACTHLRQASFSINGHRTHAIGELSDFLGELYSDRAVPCRAAYRALCDEIRRRTQDERVVANQAILDERRTITRERFQALIGAMDPSRKMSDVIARYLIILANEGLGFDEIDGLECACPVYEADRLAQADAAIERARRAVRDAAIRLRKDGQGGTKLTGFLERLETTCANDLRLITMLRTRHYSRLMALEAIVESQSLSSTRTEPQDEGV